MRPNTRPQARRDTRSFCEGRACSAASLWVTESTHLDQAFPEASPHTAPYGYDWLGRQFCAQGDDACASSLMFEPGTGEVLEIPVPFAAIHDEDLVDHRNEALASDFFAAYLDPGGQAAAITECVGYRPPCFLVAKTSRPISNSSTSTSTGTWRGSWSLGSMGCRPAPRSTRSPGSSQGKASAHAAPRAG